MIAIAPLRVVLGVPIVAIASEHGKIAVEPMVGHLAR